MEGGGDPGGELLECKDDTECLALLCLVLPGSLKDMSFLMACGLSVPFKRQNTKAYLKAIKDRTLAIRVELTIESR